MHADSNASCLNTEPNQFRGPRRMLQWTSSYATMDLSILWSNNQVYRCGVTTKTARQLALRFHAADGSNKAMLHGTFNTCFLTIHRLKSTNKYHENERQSSNDDERIQNGAEIPYDV